MKKHSKLNIVNSLGVSKPCRNKNFATNSTETKTGWYCYECEKEVHDLSRYSEQEILKLIEKTEGSFCALIQRNSSGAILTKEPISYSKALIATGALLVSTSLIQDEVSAQVVPADTVKQETSVAELGEVAPSSSSSSSSENNQETKQCTEPKAHNVVELGMIAVPKNTERGRVVVKKDKNDK